ncbi:hypothetical protein [Actinacidiphila oryziradicis]|nr:hypothetical protein [Actinacidiphila oryziradicis]
MAGGRVDAQDAVRGREQQMALVVDRQAVHACGQGQSAVSAAVTATPCSG